MPPKPEPVGLRIELEHVKPLVWRRIVVSNQWTLASLHNYVQWVVGWQGSHAHEFHVGSRVIAPQWWIRETEFDRETMHCVDAYPWRPSRAKSVWAVLSSITTTGVMVGSIVSSWRRHRTHGLTTTSLYRLVRLGRMPAHLRMSVGRTAPSIFLHASLTRIATSTLTRAAGSAVSSIRQGSI